VRIGVEQFASGEKRSYYGKGDVLVYRLNRDGRAPSGQSPVFGANVLLLVYGDAFWPTYTDGDNTGLIATDSMKNFIQRETFEFEGDDLADYCRFIGLRFLGKYPHVGGARVSATEVPYSGIDGAVAFAPAGPERAFARVELRASEILEAVAGIRGFKLLRLGGSAFHGFIRDEYTTLPDIRNRPLHMWLDLEWRYTDPAEAFGRNCVTARAREIVRDEFRTFESGSIQQVIYRMGNRLLAEIPSLAEVRLEANNRTWLPVAERGEEFGVYMEPPPPYGCLGLTLKR
jgi:urate oxidase/2-oxo-4-hydroxy-4-carboxy-5-ureidoimidazoline decarboxylase